MTEKNWIVVVRDTETYTSKLRVEGGWLYKTESYSSGSAAGSRNSGPPSVSTTFVPDSVIEKFQLDDAEAPRLRESPRVS